MTSVAVEGKYSEMNNKTESVPYWSPFLKEGIMMHQTTSQCCRFCCCQPNIDWTVHPLKKSQEISIADDQLGPAVFQVTEDAGYCGRTWSHCYPGFRATTYSVKSTDPDDQRILIKHEKKQTCPINFLLGYGDQGQPIRCPCCCFLPYLDTYDAITNQKLGSSKVICNCKPLCCPKFAVHDADDKPKYLLRPDLCWCDQCYDVKCGKGAKCCYIPFYIRDYVTEDKLGDEDVAIVDLFIGLEHELCTKKNLYAIKFPESASDADKATLMGAVLVYDITLNEQQQ